MNTKRYFVSVALLCALTYSMPGRALEGFESICTLDENCAVEKATLVAFESPGLITYKTLSGNFLCSPASFDLEADTAETVDDAQCYAMSMTSSSASSSSSSGPASAEQPIEVESGTFAVVALSSGKALVLAQTADKEPRVLQQNFRQLPGQTWRISDLGNGYHSISHPKTGLALEIKDWDTRDGAKLGQSQWINSWNQHWQLEPAGNGAYSIRSRFSGHALDVYRMDDKHNAEVVLWTYWGGDNQHWRLIPIALPEAADQAQ